MIKANFTHSVHNEFILVVDSDTSKSVTNDVLNVLSTIAEKENLETFDKHKIIYRDTDGNWDGIRTAGLDFVAFYYIGGKNAQDAMNKMSGK